MAVGYSGTPLAKKLGIKPDTLVVALGAPENYRDLLAPFLPDRVTFTHHLPEQCTFVHLFTTEKAVLESRLPQIKAALQPNGMCWLSWPKKASKVPTEVDEHDIRQAGLAQGLVDVKICAVDAVWSGLKFVYRLQDR